MTKQSKEYDKVRSVDSEGLGPRASVTETSGPGEAVCYPFYDTMLQVSLQFRSVSYFGVQFKIDAGNIFLLSTYQHVACYHIFFSELAVNTMSCCNRK